VKVIIIGNGIGGVMTASKLRTMEPDPAKLEIDIYTREAYEYYSRVRLPEVCATLMSAEDLAVYKSEWYEKKNIRVFKNQEVAKIDRAAKEIVLKNGKREQYDKLVLAMGSDAFKLPIKNADLDGIFTIREYGDADTIRQYITRGTKHAVVIGGGLLGLEAARHIRAAKIDTLTIIEVFPRLLPRQLDEEGARILKKVIERLGCTVILGAQASEFCGDKQVKSLRLKDGRELPAETVLISAGIKPRIALAKDAGLTVNKGILVDDHLRTNDKDIFVAGDLVEFNGMVWGIIPAALDHAPVVANNILGNEHIKYKQTIPQNTLKVVGINMTSMGKVTFDDGHENEYTILKKTNEKKERYEKYVVKDGKLVGSILLGSKDNLGWLTQKIGKEITEKEIKDHLNW
jgi:nitrite reductase (NADH) large subunit